jgi:hypothetical protein
VIHIVGDRLEDMTPLLHRVGAMDSPAGAGAAPVIRLKSRDFH